MEIPLELKQKCMGLLEEKSDTEQNNLFLFILFAVNKSVIKLIAEI